MQTGRQSPLIGLSIGNTKRRHQPERASVRFFASANSRRITPAATPEMLARRASALASLRGMGGLKDVIPDPAAWQREIREDVVLPGRK